MGSKVNNNGERQSCEKMIVTCSEALHRQSKIQKIQQHQKGPCLEEMIPSISNHLCDTNPNLSPSTIRKSIGNHEQDTLPSPQIESVELSSLVSTMVNKNLNVFRGRNEATSVQLNQDGMSSFGSSELLSINTSEFVDNPLPEIAYNETYTDETAYEYDKTSTTPMIIDTVVEPLLKDCIDKYSCSETPCPQTLSTSVSTANQLSTKAFYPDRMPKRSSIKNLKGVKASSSLLENLPSIGVTREIYQIILPGQIKPIGCQRSIAFNDKIDVHNIESIRLQAPGGSQSLWYQEKEYETIKLKTLALLDRVDHTSGVVDGKKYCTRGLEKFMAPEATEVKKHQAWDSVLNEQFLQRKDGEFDEETLANIYMYSTKRSRMEALKRARLDAEASEAYIRTSFPGYSLCEGWKGLINSNRFVSM